MSDRPLVSVLIGVYNAAPYIGDAISSVLSQSYDPIELIVVDDGSDDGSADVARSYSGPITVVSQPRGGIGAARNTCVELATGSFFAFLDADDRFPREKIAHQMAAFENDPAADVVFGHVSEFVSPDIPLEDAARLRAPITNVQWRSPNLMIVRRDSFFRVGLYATNIRVGIGVDWYARASDMGLKMIEIPQVVLERRLHLENNGIRERESRSHYLRVLKASVDRRRSEAAKDGPDPGAASPPS